MWQAELQCLLTAGRPLFYILRHAEHSATLPRSARPRLLATAEIGIGNFVLELCTDVTNLWALLSS